MPGTQSKDTKVGVKQSHHRSNYRQQELKLKNIKARAKQIPHQRKGNEKTRGGNTIQSNTEAIIYTY
jgi:hypothetical protein